MGVAHRALQRAEGDGDFLLLVGGVAENNLYRIVHALGLHHHTHITGGRIGLFTLIDHVEVGAGDIHVHTGCLKKVHMVFLARLQNQLCAGRTLFIRILRSTKGIFLQSRQLVQALNHTGGIVLGGKILEDPPEGIRIVNAAHMDHRDHAGTVDDHRGGISIHLQHLRPGRIHRSHGEIQLQLLFEGRDILHAVVDAVHGNQRHIPGILGVGLVHVGELCPTGVTFDEPKVQHHCLFGLQQLTEGIFVAVGIRHGEIPDGVAQLIAHILRIQVLHGGSLQHKQVLLAGNRVGFLCDVAGRHIGKHRIAVTVLYGSSKGDLTLGIGLVEPGQFRLLLVLINIYTDAFQRRAALGFHLNGKGPVFTLVSIGLGIVRILLAAAGHGDQHTGHQQQRPRFCKNLLHFCHRVLLSRRGSLHYNSR